MTQDCFSTGVLSLGFTVEKQSCVIYQLTCDQDSNHKYIGETKRNFLTRFKEHKKLDKPTAVGEHTLNTGHTVSMTNAKILGKEENWKARKIKEAIKIRTQRPLLNRDSGIQLSPVYDRIIYTGGRANTPSFIDKNL